jgi:hypothetical protein
MAKANDWNRIRHALDNSGNFDAIFNSPWYADAVYAKFSDAEYARRHEAARRVASTAFRSRGAQSRPICMHGLDLITSVPFVSVDEVKGEPYDRVMQPGATYSIEITPVSVDGTFGIFFSRSFAISASGADELTPYPIDEILVAG